MSGMNILTCDCTCPTEGVDCVCDVTVDAAPEGNG